MSYRLICVLAIVSLLLSQATVVAQSADNLEQLFENSIRPVLSGTCYRCHGDPNAKVSAGLKVDSRAGLITGGDSGTAIDLDKVQESLLLKAIERTEGVMPMPPNKDQSLRPDQIAAFKKWIAAGAPWPESATKFQSQQHWAFQPLKSRDALHDASRDIDYWIRSRQQVESVEMAPPADKRTLLRRATLDLTGLPPTYEQVVDFLADDSPQAYARLIDRLLDSPAYGERWARHWLDVVRYADTAGETADYPVPNAWRYRNYVIDAFNQDRPYDQFLREQIAGDILAENEVTASGYASKVTATGYLAISRRFGFDSENYHHLTIQDTIDTLGQSVLGLSLGCARCHDHKFDPISMQDYYGLFGIFDSSRYAFPGSEQKQKVRSMMPLVPAREALAQWRSFDEQISVMRQKLERNGQSTTPAVLRMLNDMDGDFELQAPAAGGSNGVLVPPWIAEGPVAVAASAQSPFRNVYGPGKSGIRIESTSDKVASDKTTSYRVTQAVYPQRTAQRDRQVIVNLDFRVPAAPESATGTHEVWIGGYPHSPAIVLTIGRTQLSWQRWSPDASETAESSKSAELGSLTFEADKWINLRLAVDLVDRPPPLGSGGYENPPPLGSGGYENPPPLGSGGYENRPPLGSGGYESGVTIQVGEPNGPRRSATAAFHPKWNGAIDYFMLRSATDSKEGLRPAIEFDNVAVLDSPAASTDGNSDAAVGANGEDMTSLTAQIKELVSTDSSFEMQTVETPPAAPWNAGPNSVVKIMERAQSPRNSGDDQLGVHMPNRGQYDGFGAGLPAAWKADQQERLLTSFDFRCADAKAGGQGSWRYYVGHGPGNSAAVELFFNAEQIISRSGDDRSPIGSIKVGAWYQVELELNLKTRTFTGRLHALDSDVEDKTWQGSFASGWDGTIDHTFIDSYGHIAGVRPALDVDNYSVDPAPAELSPLLAAESAQHAIVNSKRQQVMELRTRLARLKEELKREAESLQEKLTNGPFDMAYAVAEGTPHNVAIQLRGEPGQPGEVVPRGFIKVLGARPLPANVPGSGRLQLAEWLTRDCAALTARVMVNRIWQYHFGRGLVATPNDFGVRGAEPTHPELLDQLASDFIESGWSMKAAHRQIMLSQTYQQASVWPGSAKASLLSRDLYVGFTRRRLSAEEIRDLILSVSGLLDSAPGREHPFTAPTSWGYSQHAPFSAVYDHDKRSIYLMTQRLKRHPFLALFDGSDPNASTAVRLGTTVPTQALYFMNDPFVHRASAAWAERLSKTNAQADRLRGAFELAYQRQPTASELEDANQFIEAYLAAESSEQVSDPQGQRALSAWLRAMLGSNEFLHVD